MVAATSSNSDSCFPTLSQPPSGILVDQRAGALHITLPAHFTRETTRDIVEWLYDASEATPPDVSWILDLSNVDRLPLWLIGSLCSHAERLRNQGMRCVLHGVQGQHFGVRQISRLREIFGTENVHEVGRR